MTIRTLTDGKLLYEGLLDVGTQRDWRLHRSAVTNRAYCVPSDRNSLSVVQGKEETAP